ncbi:hypothetical protein F7O89_05770 [Pseudomonas aeruginosa]|nr:hypothetical protein F7O89_05770 [Pseudomonas aeruginosa]
MSKQRLLVTRGLCPVALLVAQGVAARKSQTVSGELGLSDLAQVFTLPWLAYAGLLSVKDADDFRGTVSEIQPRRTRGQCMSRGQSPACPLPPQAVWSGIQAWGGVDHHFGIKFYTDGV